MRASSTVRKSTLMSVALLLFGAATSFASNGSLDSDGDSILDDVDNCTFFPNTNQFDWDGDGYGNPCDGDFNNDCQTNVLDLALLRLNYFSSGVGILQDMNSDGVVGVIDLGLMRSEFFTRPGPSAFGSCPQE